jgi:hypothetical protein
VYEWTALLDGDPCCLCRKKNHCLDCHTWKKGLGSENESLSHDILLRIRLYERPESTLTMESLSSKRGDLWTTRHIRLCIVERRDTFSRDRMSLPLLIFSTYSLLPVQVLDIPRIENISSLLLLFDEVFKASRDERDH